MIALIAIALLAADEPIYLGILETSANPQACGQSAARAIRVAFQFAQHRWAAVPADHKYPAQLSWTLALDGARMGQATSVRTAASAALCSIGIQNLKTQANLPESAVNVEAFATWPGTPRFRPIVAVSKSNFTDPDRWKPFQPSPQQFRALDPAFRKEIALPLRCGDEAVRDYPESFIKPIAKGYRSATGKMLVGFLSNEACTEWASPIWFLVDGERSTLIGVDITLLDSGDYDGDGSSELLFQMSAYNRDGYLLFRSGDLSKTLFSWQYH